MLGLNEISLNVAKYLTKYLQMALITDYITFL